MPGHHRGPFPTSRPSFKVPFTRSGAHEKALCPVMWSHFTSHAAVPFPPRGLGIPPPVRSRSERRARQSHAKASP